MRCWLLRRHKLHIPRPAASGRSRSFRCASSQNRNRVAGLRFCSLHVGATLAFPVVPRTHPLSGQKPHTAATRASRRRTVPAVEGCKDANRSRRYPCPLAPANARAIGRRGAPKECRDFRFAIFSVRPKCRAALQAQGLPRLVLAASETCAARLPSAWSLSAPALCRSGCCQQSHRRSPSTESRAPDEVQMQWLRPPGQGCFVLRDNAERIAAFQPPDDQNASG